MSTSNKRSLVFIIIFLLLTNIGVLAYFLWDKKPKSKTEPNGKQLTGMAASLQKDVGFDSVQIAEFKKLKEKQWVILKPMFEDIRKAKDSLYRMISNERVSDSTLSTTADLIAQRQKALDLQAFNNFKEIRTVCRPEQLAKYDSLVLRMMRKMGKPQRSSSSSDQKKKG